MSAKTVAPTRRRLQRAHAHGDLPISGVLVGAAGLVAAMALLPATVRALAAYASDSIRSAIQSPTTTDVTATLAGDVLTLTVPILAAIAVTAVAAGLVQSGGVVSFQSIAPELRRARPSSGLTGATRVLAAAGGVAVALVLAYVTARVLMTHGADLAAVVGQCEAIPALLDHLLTRLGWIAALLILAFSAIHAIAVRHQWRARVWMTPAQQRHEARATHGDPEVRAARRREHERLLRE